MAKQVSSEELDNGLVKTQEARQVTVCTTQPASYAEATTLEPAGRMLAEGALTAPDLVLGPGDTANGRKVTITPPSALTIGATGTAQHVCLTKPADTLLMTITTCNPLALDVGGGSNTVTVPAYKREATQPT